MALKIKISSILLIPLGISCSKIDSLFENKNKTCLLKLYSDSTYSYITPSFFGQKKETGTFQLNDSKIKLIREEENNLSNIDIGYLCSEDNPESLSITFKNIHRDKIKVKFLIENSKDTLKTNSLGEIELKYNELEEKEIIKSNGRISKFTFFYMGKKYSQSMESYKNSRKPERLDFVLNQFMGKEKALLNRVYNLKKDTIFINDISVKLTGTGYRYMLKK